MIETILLLNPVYVTLFWAITLCFNSKSKHAPKVFLSFFMAVAFVLYLSHFFYFSDHLNTYIHLDSLYIWTSLLVYPLFHIYIRLLTTDKRISFRKHSRFLILPTLIFIFHLVGVLLIDRHQHIDFLKNVLNGIEEAKGTQIYLLRINYAYRIVFIIQVLYYLYLNFKLITKNKRKLKDYYSNTESRDLYWVQFFNISLALTSLASIVAAFIGREAFAGDVASLVLPSAVFSSLLFFIGLIGNKQNAVHTEEDENVKIKISDSEGNHSIKGFKRILESLFEKDKIFTNPELKIWDLSKMLGTNRTYVSKLINSEYNRNFCNHVNYYRVQHAKELIQKNPQITNEQIAELSGFGSQNSLYRAFQLFEGIPLKRYRRGFNDL